MGNLLSYSGITTKIRAMHKHLITKEQYEQLSAMPSVSDGLAFLKQQPAYSQLFAHLDEKETHRSQIESLLTNSLYHDYSKLYRFANMIQRKFMDLFFVHYEISVLKICLRSAYSNSELTIQLPLFEDFFKKHSQIDIIKLGNCSSLNEFIECLRNTRYYKPLTMIHESNSKTLFDYEMGLDLYYFSYMWKEKDKVLKGKELDVITHNFGHKLDLLNVQWIYRSKKNYHLTPAEIYALIIPVNYKLKPQTISAMVEANTTEELQAILKNTYYGKRYIEDSFDSQSIEMLYMNLLEQIYLTSSKRNPYSIASINCYLYLKEYEIFRITTIIEGIRYGLTPKEIAQYTAKI